MDRSSFLTLLTHPGLGAAQPSKAVVSCLCFLTTRGSGFSFPSRPHLWRQVADACLSTWPGVLGEVTWMNVGVNVTPPCRMFLIPMDSQP